MQLSILAVLLSTCSLALGCAGRGPCHDGPYRPNLVGDLGINNLFGMPVPKPPGKLGPTKPGGPAPKTAPKKARRSLDPYTLHVARQAVLAARGFYDDDSELGNVYAREADYDDLYAREAEFDEEYVSLSSRSEDGGPLLPRDADPIGFHIFTRLNTIPKAYPPFGNVDHAGLNKLMADLGGQHVDVVYYKPSSGFHECGLFLKDMLWTRTHSNADNYPVIPMCRELQRGERDLYTYVGQYGGESVKRLCEKPSYYLRQRLRNC